MNALQPTRGWSQKDAYLIRGYWPGVSWPSKRYLRHLCWPRSQEMALWRRPFNTVKHWAHIAERGRAWLADEESARFNLVFGNIKGLDWIDSLESWQIVAAAYLTPTVGLGCRSGGCMIFAILSFALSIFEFLLLWLTTRRGWFAFSIHTSAVQVWVTNINVLYTVCGIWGRSQHIFSVPL